MPNAANGSDCSCQRDLLLATKLHPPTLKPGLLPRDRLVGTLDANPSARLILVSAAPGFGKTTAVAQWLSHRKRPVAWLSLDSGDNDAACFLRYLVAAVQRAEPGVGSDAAALLRGVTRAPDRTALTMLVNDLCGLDDGLALVLDDYHVIESREVHAAVEFLLASLPAGMPLVMTTRADPPLPLARLRSLGQLTELRADDLRFSSAEAAMVMDQELEVAVSPDDASALAARTEGWATGIQLAIMSLRGKADPSEFIREFSGTNRYILDYLVEEVIARQPAEMQEFLLQTSILGSISAPLCDAVVQPRPAIGARAMLERLERGNLFVAALDDERCCYRYHQLFADLLRARYRQLSPDAVREAHLRASLWYEGEGLVKDAADHALEAGAMERAAQLIVENAASLFLAGEYSTLLGLIGRLPSEVAASKPWVLVWRGYVLSWAGATDGVDALLSEAESRLAAEDNSTDSRRMRTAIAVARARVANLRGDAAGVLAQAQIAICEAPQDELLNRAVAEYLVALGHLLTGRPNEAAQSSLATIRLCNELGAGLWSANATMQLAEACMLQGRPRQALKAYEEAATLTVGLGKGLFSRGPFDTGIAQILLEWNRIDEAERLLEAGLSDLEAWATDSGCLFALSIRIALCLARGDVPGAEASAAAVVQLVEGPHVTPIHRARYVLERTRLYIATGDLAGAEQSGIRSAGAEPALILREAKRLCAARLDLALGNVTPAGSALARLSEETRIGGRLGTRVKVLALQALALDAMGKTDDALAALGVGLTIAEPEGYVRSFVDEGEGLARLLREGQRADAWSGRGVAEYVEKLLDVFSGEPARQKSAGGVRVQSLVEPLSERELQVLLLIAEGMSNRQIAGRLILSIGTVKSHTHHIFGKLAVSNRTQMAVRARELGLLD